MLLYMFFINGKYLPEVHEVDLFLHFLYFLSVANASTVPPLLLVGFRTDRRMIGGTRVALSYGYLMFVH
jgi:hypothetical protein